MHTTLPPNGAATRTIRPWSWQDQFGYSQAPETTARDRILYCAGQTSMSEDGVPLHAGDMGAQVGRTLDNLDVVLREAGYDLADLVRLTVYTTDVDAFFAHYGELGGRLSAAGAQPAITLLGVTRLAYPELMVEIEATAAK